MRQRARRRVPSGYALDVRALGLLLILAGAILGVVNALYLPFALEAHQGEWPIAAFHGGGVLASTVVLCIGLYLRRSKGSERR